MQEPIYSAEDEAELMARLWGPALAQDPERFVLFVYPWGQPGTPLAHQRGPRAWQRERLRELREHIAANKGRVTFEMLRDATASGRGAGKSALVSWLAHWMLSTRIGSSVIVSANSENQLRSVTWAEMTKWLAMACNSHWFEVSATRIVPAAWLTRLVERDFSIGTRYWGAEGKLWSEENPDGYAGPHNPHGMMVVFDEASGIPDSIWAVAQGFFTENAPDRYWLAYSNPRRNSGYFFECFNSKRDFWVTRHIDAREVEGTDPSVYQHIIDEYGADSDEARVEVYGQFPKVGEGQFIAMNLVEEAMRRPRHDDDTAPIVIGVDPASGHGPDSTVIAVRQGRDVIALRRFRESDTMETVGHVIDAIEEFRPALVCIDEGGLGAGVVDRLKEQRYKVRGVNFGWPSKRRIMYGNKRVEMWGEMREWLRGASLPDDRFLRNDLVAPLLKPDSRGTLFLESKQDMKKRKLPSPDAADAIALTFAFPVGHREERPVARRPRTTDAGYDPLVDGGYGSRYSPSSAASWMGH